MVVFVKLFFLAVRQVSKPLANQAKRTAKQSELFQSLCVGVGRMIHRGTIQLDRRADGKEQLAHIAPLNATAALDRGAEFFSELIIYSVAGATVVYEYNLNERQKKQKAEQDADKETRRRAEMRVNEEKQWEEFRELNRRITSLQEELLLLRQEQRAALIDSPPPPSSRRSWWR